MNNVTKEQIVNLYNDNKELITTEKFHAYVAKTIIESEKLNEQNPCDKVEVPIYAFYGLYGFGYGKAITDFMKILGFSEEDIKETCDQLTGGF